MSLNGLDFKKFKENQASNNLNATVIYDDDKDCEKGNFYMLLKEDYIEESEIIKGFEDFVEKKIDDVVKIETQLPEEK